VTAADNPAGWRGLNRAWWDERAPLHAASRFYKGEGLGLERFEWQELPAVNGLRMVHLQCHIGTDSIDLARHGARVTGLDFSAAAIESARRLGESEALDGSTDWVVADVYDAVEALGEGGFDAVYTGKGALCWIPDLTAWSEVVSGLIRPGGFLYLSEFHPFQDIMSDTDTDLERSYFPTGGELFDNPGSYVDRDAVTFNNTIVDFVHPISEVINSLIGAGLRLRFLNEHAVTVHERWPWMIDLGGRVWAMPADRPAIPLMFSLIADKPEDRVSLRP